MHTMVFLCPTTDEAVDSGIEVEMKSLAFALMMDTPMRCPHCRERHVFKAETAKLRKAA